MPPINTVIGYRLPQFWPHHPSVKLSPQVLVTTVVNLMIPAESASELAVNSLEKCYLVRTAENDQGETPRFLSSKPQKMT